MGEPHGEHQMASGPPSFTWTCTDCPAWAEQYWHAPGDAERDPGAETHVANCPAGGRIVIVRRSAQTSPEQAGAERLIGTYDPNELLVVPYWAVLAARGLAGVMARQAELGGRLDLSSDAYLRLIGGAVLAADPLPDTTEPLDQHDLARLLRRLADTLAGALPKP